MIRMEKYGTNFPVTNEPNRSMLSYGNKINWAVNQKEVFRITTPFSYLILA